MTNRSDLVDAILRGCEHDNPIAAEVTDQALLLQRDLCKRCDRDCALKQQVLAGELARCPGSVQTQRRRRALGLPTPHLQLLAVS